MYKLSLPIYYTQHFKTKKDKTFLVGMNVYRNAHYFLQNELKKHYHKLVISLLSDFKGDTLTSYRVKYKLYYKNPSCDLDNIVSLIGKFLNDSLQDLKIIKNDNVKIFTRYSAEVIEKDVDNPRLEIEIEENL